MKETKMIEAITQDREEYVRQTQDLGRSKAPLAKATALAYVIFERKSLDTTENFMQNFGLLTAEKNKHTLHMRGIDSRPAIFIARAAKQNRFIGMGFEVADLKDLKNLAAAQGADIVPNALGGQMVRLVDPVGHSIEVTYNLPQVEPRARQPLQGMNMNGDTVRLLEAVRLKPRPAEVTRLGHTVISGPKSRELIGWYAKHLGLIVSDFQFLPKDYNPVMAFMRLDLGAEPTDHHTLGIGAGLRIGHVHSAFEVTNFDQLIMGSQWLEARAAKHSWGVGRHILGSQIFNYWRDPSGELFEHYTDGDVFDGAKPIGYYYFSKESLAQWAPPVTNDFLEKNLSLSTARQTISRLLGDDELTIDRLLELARRT